MLTEQDINDLKQFCGSFDEFCAQNECGESCIVFQKKKSSKNSCFKEYCDWQRSILQK